MISSFHISCEINKLLSKKNIFQVSRSEMSIWWKSGAWKKQQKTILKTQLAFKSHFKYDEKKEKRIKFWAHVIASMCKWIFSCLIVGSAWGNVVVQTTQKKIMWINIFLFSYAFLVCGSLRILFFFVGVQEEHRGNMSRMTFQNKIAFVIDRIPIFKNWKKSHLLHNIFLSIPYSMSAINNKKKSALENACTMLIRTHNKIVFNI